MTEKELRQTVANTALSYLGCKESDGSHRAIIDLYNSHRPLARGYKLLYTDSWCAGFVSAIAIACGITDILPTEVGCGKQIQLFKDLGEWVEDDAYIPNTGDVIYYDWDDSGIGDDTTSPDHVGLVLSCDGKNTQVIEGNYSDSVKIRTISVNGRYIRGYGCPDYASKASEDDSDTGCGCTALEAKVAELEKRVAYLEGKAKVYRTLLDVPSWAQPEIKALCEAGLLEGDGSGALNIPKAALQPYLLLHRVWEACRKEVG